MRRALSRIPLRFVIAATIVMLLIVTAALTWYCTFRDARISIRELAEQLGRESMANARQHLASYLAVPELLNAVNALPFSDNPDDPPAPRSQLARYESEIKLVASVRSIAFADGLANYVGVSRQYEDVPYQIDLSDKDTQNHLEAYRMGADGSNAGLIERFDGSYDPRIRPWYLAAVRTGGPTWTPVYVWTSGTVGIDAVMPVFASNGSITGVLDTSLTLSDIGEFLSQVRATPHAQAFIIDRSGELVASSRDNDPMDIKQVQATPIVATDSGDPMVRSGAQHIMTILHSDDAMPSVQQMMFRVDGKLNVMFVSPYRRTPGIDWIIAEVVPVSDFAQGIYLTMRTTIAAVTVLLLLSMGIALFLARRITAPLEVLTFSARKLAEGSLEQPIAIEGSDEVGRLAASFNSMAHALKKSFAALTESDARYRAFVANSASGILRFETDRPMPLFLSEEEQIEWLYDHFRLAEHNDAAIHILGYRRREDLMGKGPEAWLDRAFPENLAYVREMIHSSFSLANGESCRVDQRGKMRWILNSVSGIVENGHLLRMWGVLRDISSRKEAEEALRASERRYRRRFHRSSVALFEVDVMRARDELEALRRDGVTNIETYLMEHPSFTSTLMRGTYIVEANETARELFEAKSTDELLGPLDSTVDTQLFAVIAPQAIAGIQDGQRHETELTLRTRTGKQINVLMSLTMPTGDDADTNMLIAVNDVTKRVQAERERARVEEQLLQAQKMESVGRLAGGIAHDINNLLTAILGFTELLTEELTDPLREGARMAHGAAQRIRDLAQKLLAFGRKQRLAKTVTDLRGVVKDFEILLRHSLEKKITIRLELPSDLGKVLVDVGQLEQVLMNLAVNAQDAMPEGGTMTMSLSDERADESWARERADMAAGPYVVLKVSDTGTGMSPETAAQIFEPFFTTKEPGKGTGLGLSTVYGIVKQHGGHIEVTSALGAGTTFTIHLPRVE